jgi:two-component system sensor histidine kinase CpxA
MKPRWTLSRKIFSLALLNLALLAAALVLFARAQFHVGAESLLLGPAHDRIRGIADAFNAELDAAPEAGRDALIQSYAQRYGADFFLVAGRGQAIAGPQVTLPDQLRDGMRRLLPPPGGADPQGRGARPRPAPEPREGPPPERDAGIPPGPPPDGGPGFPPPFRKREGGFGPGPPPQRRFRPPVDDDRPTPPPRPQLPVETVFLWVQHAPTAYWAGARIHSMALTGAPGNLGVLLIRSGTVFNSRLFFDWRLWLAVALTVIGVSVLCWMPFLRGLAHSIAHMDRVAQQIAEGRFDVQAAPPRSDELGHLGQQIDRMAVRLQSFVKNQKRFLGDIAHELCAPIARVQFALGILEQKAEEGQRRHVASLHDEIQEMSALVNELLSFSKAGMHAGSAALAPVAVAAVVDKAVAREAFAGGSIDVRVAPELQVRANEGLLLRALANVLRNAIRYAGDSGPIAIFAERDGAQVAIVVTDSGPGLPDAELEEVFAPFYRPEAARTRETGGAGLGLAIVRTCVEACGGTVSCRNRKPTGLEVAIRLEAP